jgi:hypothetical protein
MLHMLLQRLRQVKTCWFSVRFMSAITLVDARVIAPLIKYKTFNTLHRAALCCTSKMLHAAPYSSLDFDSVLLDVFYM